MNHLPTWLTIASRSLFGRAWQYPSPSAVAFINTSRLLVSTCSRSQAAFAPNFPLGYAPPSSSSTTRWLCSTVPALPRGHSNSSRPSASRRSPPRATSPPAPSANNAPLRRTNSNGQVAVGGKASPLDAAAWDVRGLDHVAIHVHGHLARRLGRRDGGSQALMGRERSRKLTHGLPRSSQAWRLPRMKLPCLGRSASASSSWHCSS